jgi:hypothetical protein
MWKRNGAADEITTKRTIKTISSDLEDWENRSGFLIKIWTYGSLYKGIQSKVCCFDYSDRCGQHNIILDIGKKFGNFLYLKDIECVKVYTKTETILWKLQHEDNKQ